MALHLFEPHNYLRPTATGQGLYYDPVYGYVPLPPIIRRAMDLPSLQRLRHVSQLSTVELVFPGATHNRLEHSVGVYHIATMVFDAISVKEEAKRVQGKSDAASLSPAMRLAVQLASLFHDVGHGPYSHVFELFCRRNPDFTDLDHHKLTELLIAKGTDRYDDIPKFLGKLYEEWSQKPQPYPEWKEDAILLSPKNIAAIAVGKYPPDKPGYTFLSEIISNPVVDVDRMDYLVRDSHHCNVLIGGTDIWEILHSFVVIPKAEHGRTIWKLKIRKEAIKSVEALLTARDLAYRTVYYHPMHRIAQEMMITALFELTEQRRELKPEEIASFTDDELLMAFNEGSSFTKDVAKRIYFRGLYEPLPFRLNLRRDLDEATQQRVLELATPKTKNEYAERFRRGERGASAIRLPAHQKIVFDLEPVPVTDKEAYRQDCLYDEATGATFSLLTESRYLQYIHGDLEFGGEKLDMHDKYLKESTDLQIGLPFEFIDRCIQELQSEASQQFTLSIPKQSATLKKGKRAKRARRPAVEIQGQLFSLSEAAGRIVDTKLRAIFDEFVEVLEIPSMELREKHWKRFRVEMAHYLLQSIRPQLATKLRAQELDKFLEELLKQVPQVT